MRPQTTRLPIDTEAKLTALGASLQQIDADYEQRRAQLEAEVARAKEVQRQLANLNRAVDDASEQLTRADGQFQQCKAAAAQIRESMLSNWGTGHVDGSTHRPPNYADLAALDASIADYPSVRVALEQKVAQAQATLTKFQEDNDL